MSSVNNDFVNLYNQAVEYTTGRSGDKTRNISAEELAQLEEIAAKDGVSAQEREFIDSLKNQTNVEKIATVGKMNFEPNSINFDVSIKNGKVELNGLDKNQEIKQRIFDRMIESGLKPEEVRDTLNFLDSVNADYAEVEKLVNNQFASVEKYKDTGWNAQDVLGAMQGYGVLKDSFNEGVPNDKYVKEVMNGLIEGKVRVDSKTERDMPTANAKYSYKDDTVFLKPNFNINSSYDKSILFHELIHTSQDIKYKGNYDVDIHQTEVETYKTQGIYMAKKGINVDSGDKIVSIAKKYGEAYNNIEKLEKKLQQTTDPEQRKKLTENLEKWKAHLSSLGEKIDDLVRDYYENGRQVIIPEGLKKY